MLSCRSWPLILPLRSSVCLTGAGSSPLRMVSCRCFGWGRAAPNRTGTQDQQQQQQQQQQAHKLQRAELSLQWPAGYVSRGAGGGTLRVLTWNILADGLAQHGDFVHVGLETSRFESCQTLCVAMGDAAAAAAPSVCNTLVAFISFARLALPITLLCGSAHNASNGSCLPPGSPRAFVMGVPLPKDRPGECPYLQKPARAQQLPIHGITRPVTSI